MVRMKKLNLLYAILVIFTSAVTSCGDVNYDLDESVLSGLRSFEYRGYTYYVHPRLGPYIDDIDYKNIKKEVKKLDSYGFRSWFVPSIDELQQAANNGLLVGGSYYISSSKGFIKYLCLVPSYGGWTVKELNWYDDEYVVPMIKFRK